VDAGYLLAWGAERRVGARAPRVAVAWNFGNVVTSIRAQCPPIVGPDELLRLYWYDGATNHMPTPEHDLISELPDVKVRLGRLTQGGQKGVDTLIVLDLTTLARERAISTAFLLSGDEDIREGVVVAQQLGVRVVLFGLAAQHGQGNQARTLVREADRNVDLAAIVEPCVSHVATAPYVAGNAFGLAWTVAPAGATVAQLSAAKAANSPLPAQVDGQLRTAMKTSLAPAPVVAPLPKLEQWQILEARRGFWDAVP